MSTNPLLTLNEVAHIMADGYVCDERRSLIFLSVWGRDTAIAELLAGLTLKNEQALTQISLISADQHEHLLFPGNTDKLDKRSTRHQQTRFGTLLHLWLFDKRCLLPDQANGRAFLLTERNSPHWREHVWTLLRETTTLPLLDHWQDQILAELQSSQMLIPLSSYGAVTGWQLTADMPRLTEFISQGIISGKLHSTAYHRL